MSDKSQVIKRICQALEDQKRNIAAEIAQNEYAHTTNSPTKRAYTEYQSTKIFIRDGFIDRYSGQKLVFPAVLRLISKLLPKEFPFHKNWKMSECHIVYWELFPTVDHLLPVARGGEDSESNWVCTSMLRNSAKSNWLLEELGWELKPSGDFKKWDGLIHWFMDYVKEKQALLEDKYLQRWHKAADRSLKI